MPPLRAVGAALLVLAAPSTAAADEVDRCVAASERGQEARRSGALASAREAFIACSADTCPAVVRAACAEWLDALAKIAPTVTVAITTPDGNDVASARVAIDGRATTLGSAVSLDPGVHRIDVDADGYDKATMPFVAREGEPNRVVRVTLVKKKTAEPPPRTASGGRPSAVTWITGGLAVVALGSFTYFGLTGRARAADLRDTCAPGCAESDRAAVATRYIVADVSLLGALVLGSVSLWTLVSTPAAPR